MTQLALKSNAPSVQLAEFGDVTVDPHAAVFITLNPMGKKYKGRNRLPDNLKALFLPVAMTVPDNVVIARVLLLAEGFDISLSGTLGEKIAAWYNQRIDAIHSDRLMSQLNQVRVGRELYALAESLRLGLASD